MKNGEKKELRKKLIITSAAIISSISDATNAIATRRDLELYHNNSDINIKL